MTITKKGRSSPKTGLISLPNAFYYQEIRMALATRAFISVDNSPWPTIYLTKQKIKGQIQLRPVVADVNTPMSPENEAYWSGVMLQQREQSSDLDVDILDAVFVLWSRQAGNIDEAIIVNLDEILALRGLQPKLGGEGRRGGYRRKQRIQVNESFSRLQNIWVDVSIMPQQNNTAHTASQHIQGHLLIITDYMGYRQPEGFINAKYILFHSGEIIAPYWAGSGRQAAVLSGKVLQFDPYRQRWEKRLSRYLSWQWRIRACKVDYLKPYRVSTLLENVGIAPDRRNPLRTYDRLEMAMDVLQDEGVIAGWQYERWESSVLKRRRWLREWLTWTVTIEPPDEIKEHYEGISKHKTPPSKARVKAEHLGEEIQALRKKLGLTQLQVAEQLGIDRTYLSRLECGKRGKGVKSAGWNKKVKRWLVQHEQR